mgnify:FL=1
MQEPIIIAENIIKQYGTHLALNNVNISVPRGSIYGLLGPNGAGKTTLMRIINQITAPDSGKIIFDGKKLSREHIIDIGYLPEERGLYKTMKVGEQALYLAQLKGMSKSEAIEQLKYWFSKLDIMQWWNKKIEELSKGMAQKIQFIVTIMHKPKLLIFDEPFSGFDPINASIIRQEILKLKEEGSSIIFSTHRMESVEEICDYIGLINKSQTILEGNVSDIKKQYSDNTYSISISEGYIAENNLFSIEKKEDKMYIIRLNDKVTQSEALNSITKQSSIISFKKNIASIEEIFLKAVKNE